MSGDLSFLNELSAIIESRIKEKPKGSYTAELAERGVEHISRKLVEESVEVVIEVLRHNKVGVVRETADLIYHLLVLLAVEGVKLSEVVSELKSRRR